MIDIPRVCRFATWLLLLPALASPGLAAVYLNEITVQGNENVELYNSDLLTVDVSGWTVSGADGDHVLPGGTSVPGGGYLIVPMPAPIFHNQGGYIELLDGKLDSADGVNYGHLGSAPLPPGDPFNARGPMPPTLARAPDASSGGITLPSPATDGLFWTIDLTPTPGAINDAPAADLGTSLRINELDPKLVGGGDTVELFNPFAASVPLPGWFLCNGDGFQALSGTVPGMGFLTVGTDPGFDLEAKELVYLFRDDEVRVDQIGFHSPPVRGFAPFLDVCQCYGFFPDASGPTLGYDWFSSGGGVSLFALRCTPSSSNQFVTSCATSAPELESGSWSTIKARWRPR